MSESENQRLKEAVEVFNQNAVSYQNRFMDLSNYHKGLDLFCDAINNPNAKILELACGPGNITQYLLKKHPNYRILATDLAPNMLELAQKNNPSATVQLLDCRKIKSLNQKFDGIICGFGLPFLTKEETIKFIQDAADALNSQGVLYISTMEDEFTKSGYKTSSTGEYRIYYNYHEAKYLIKALEMNGLDVLDIHRIDFKESDNTITKDLIIVAKKGKFLQSVD